MTDTAAPRSRRRGYLIPGEEPVPLLPDLLDYRPFAPSLLSADTLRSITIGRSIDLGSGLATSLLRIEIERLWRNVTVIDPRSAARQVVRRVWTPDLLRAGASVVLFDPLGTASTDETAGVAAHAWSLDPRRSSVSWNPIEGIGPNDVLALETIRAAILGTLDGQGRRRRDRDSALLVAGLRAVITSHANPSLADVADACHDRVAFDRLTPHATDRVWRWSEMEAASDLRRCIELFRDRRLRERISSADVDVRALGRGQMHVSVGHDPTDIERAALAGSLFVNRVHHQVLTDDGPTQPRSVVIVLADAASVAGRARLAAKLAESREGGAVYISLCHSVDELVDTDVRNAIVQQVAILGLCAGASDASARAFLDRVHARGGPLIGSREIEALPFGVAPMVVHAPELDHRPIAIDIDATTVRPGAEASSADR